MDEIIKDLGSLLYRSDDVVETDWDMISIVFDLLDGGISNSGFLYKGDTVEPIIADIDDEPTIIDDKVIDFKKFVTEKFGHEFKQLLIQMEKGTGRIKIDFEFDDPTRWSIGPGNLKEMREFLRPKFD